MKKIKIQKYRPSLKSKLLPIFKQYPEMFFDSDLETIKKRLSQDSIASYPKYCAEIGGQPVGFISYFKARDSENIWFLSWFVVDKDCQNQGIGRKLMTFVEKKMAKSLTPRMYIETVGAKNAVTRKTRAFYKKCGYKQVGLIPDYYGRLGSKVFFSKT